jgi:hypothetical protein
MGFSEDKHLKIDKPFGTVYLSTESCRIKVFDTAPSDNTRADEIAIDTTKTGKVTKVVAVMSIYCKKNAIRGELIPGTRSFLAKRRKMLISRRKIPTD